MKTALVIEDNVNNMELITFILQANGFKTLQALKGKLGIELFNQKHPDFVLLDIQLPDIDGLDVLKTIKKSVIGQNTPVIAVTSYAMTGDSKKLINAGCNGYIEKPIDPDSFISEINSIVNNCAATA